MSQSQGDIQGFVVNLVGCLIILGLMAFAARVGVEKYRIYKAQQRRIQRQDIQAIETDGMDESLLPLAIEMTLFQLELMMLELDRAPNAKSALNDVVDYSRRLFGTSPEALRDINIILDLNQINQDTMHLVRAQRRCASYGEIEQLRDRIWTAAMLYVERVDLP